MGRHAAAECPELDAKIDAACAGIGAEIGSLAIPGLAGVVLGGGYGRGEGGVRETAEGPALSNDLDFYVVTEEGAGSAERAAIAKALAPVSEKWSAKLGADADFCEPKTPWRLKHDEERIMVQELVRGYFDVAGKKGGELFAHVARRPPEAIPWMEAARLLMNRGIGLLFARGKEARVRFGFEDPRGDFAARNVNKCVLGAGDAKLVVRGAYRWRAEERAAALGDGLYRDAVEWKFRPRAEAPCSWEAARKAWLDAEEEAMERGRREGALKRSLREGARWIARSRSFGGAADFGRDCTVRVLLRVAGAVRGNGAIDAELVRLWRIFN